MVTHPLRYTGRELSVNSSTSAGGSVRVEIQDADGRPYPGFALADCPAHVGDSLAQVVRWKKGGDLSSLAGRVVRLRFELQEADLFALQFQETSA
jgi:hypothetical protein